MPLRIRVAACSIGMAFWLARPAIAAPTSASRRNNMSQSLQERQKKWSVSIPGTFNIIIIAGGCTEGILHDSDILELNHTIRPISLCTRPVRISCILLVRLCCIAMGGSRGLWSRGYEWPTSSMLVMKRDSFNEQNPFLDDWLMTPHTLSLIQLYINYSQFVSQLLRH